jgi:hypothetical protein
LVEQKRDSNNKPFTPKPKPQQKSEMDLKSLKIRIFEKIKKKTGNNLVLYLNSFKALSVVILSISVKLVL